METHGRVAQAREIMRRFAEGTGLLGSGGAPRRYLWTDAFAVCNLLALYQQSGDREELDLALRLVEQVHHVLGRHRADDPRRGWISGLDEEEGARHPTCGGLRIGKALREREPGEPFDEELEWERDGQYFHYLSKWMLALHRVYRQTEDPRYRRWALELAKAVHARFVYLPSSGGGRRMYWKMSVDLSRPLVASMGLHDPLDGLLTYLELQVGAAAGTDAEGPEGLAAEIREMSGMCAGRDWTSDDPLGLGGILSDALRAARLMAAGRLELSGLLADLLEAAATGLARYAGSSPLRVPAEYRLAFRELGLTIGLQAAARIGTLLRERPDLFTSGATRARFESGLQEIMPYRTLGERLEEFWLAAEHQRSATWVEHRDINMVMLATSLMPDGYFGPHELVGVPLNLP